MEHFSFVWEIRNYILCNWDPQLGIQTESFIVPILGNTTWIIKSLSERDLDRTIFLAERLDGPLNTCGYAGFRLISADGTSKTAGIWGRNPPYNERYTYILMPLPSFGNVFPLNDVLKLVCLFQKTPSIADRSSYELTPKRVTAHTDVNGVLRTSLEMTLEPQFGELSHPNAVTVSRSSLRVQEWGMYDCFEIQSRIERGIDEYTVHVLIAKHLSKQRFAPVIFVGRFIVMGAEDSETDMSTRDRHVFQMSEEEEVWSFPTFISISKADLMNEKCKYLRNNVLTVKLELELSRGFSSSSIDRNSISVQIPKVDTIQRLGIHLHDLYFTHQYADVMLRVDDGETVKAHRIVLVSRSKRFAEMLESHAEMLDDDGVLDVPDLNMITLNFMLLYMYTSKIVPVKHEENAANLYVAAYKYNMRALQCYYSLHFQSCYYSLDSRNVCRILAMAHDCDDSDLKECAVDFIRNYWNRIALSEEWEKLCKERQFLAQETKKALNEVHVVKHCLKLE